MSRLFDDGASDFLRVNSGIVSAIPITMACWFRPNDVTIYQIMMQMADQSEANEQLRLACDGEVEGDPIEAASYTAANGYDAAFSTAGVTVNTWSHAAAVFATSTSRSAYVDGGNKGSDADLNLGPTNDRVAVGAGTADSTPSGYCSGDIAEAAIWSVALTDNEIAILAKGYSPLFVRPQSLEAYWPLIRGLNDRVGGYTLTATGTVVSVHPPVVLYPTRPIIL